MVPDLSIHPQIHRLDLGTLQLPSWHPRAADGISRIFAYAVEHPDGVVLFDCGCGEDSDLINAIYKPELKPLEIALGDCGLMLTDIAAVVVSHLHFDHCGQLRKVHGRPVFVQGAEIEAAQKANYTVSDWAVIPPEDCRILFGDQQIGSGLTIVSTPGHTPGHQSLVVRGGGETSIIGGQCCYCSNSFEKSLIEQDNLFEIQSAAVALDSLKRLASFKPSRVLLAHDPVDWLAS